MMRPAVRAQLLATARRARRDGWLEWELPEVVKAEARRLEIRCPPHVVRAVVAHACDNRGLGSRHA